MNGFTIKQPGWGTSITIITGLVAVIAFVVRLDFKADGNSEDIKELVRLMEMHSKTDMHQGAVLVTTQFALEQNHIKTDISEINKEIKTIDGKLDRVLDQLRSN